MVDVLAIGGNGFIGRKTVKNFIEDGHTVTVFSRSDSSELFDDVRPEYIQGDRGVTEEVERAYNEVEPEVVIDFAAFKPAHVDDAVDIFSDVQSYVYVSSTHAYDRTSTIPLKEDETPLEECTKEQAADDSFSTYGNRKAEADRILKKAAQDGFNGYIVRPAAIYGPSDQSERQDYWIDRVRKFDKVVVPGDKCRMPTHLGYVGDVSSAIRTVIQEGTPGEAYNVANKSQITFDELLGRIARTLETNVTIYHATEELLATVGLSVSDFSYGQPYPYVVSTEKIRSLGHDSTPYEEGIRCAVNEHIESDRDGSRHDPGRETEKRLIDFLDESGVKTTTYTSDR